MSISSFLEIRLWEMYSSSLYSNNNRFTDVHCFCFFSPSVFCEEYPPITEEDALAKWASDPANTAWMESKG